MKLSSARTRSFSPPTSTLTSYLCPPCPSSRVAQRRPGFSISIVDVLAFNISCKLEGFFYIPNVPAVLVGACRLSLETHALLV